MTVALQAVDRATATSVPYLGRFELTREGFLNVGMPSYPSISRMACIGPWGDMGSFYGVQVLASGSGGGWESGAKSLFKKDCKRAWSAGVLTANLAK